jgi:hypothetical protein
MSFAEIAALGQEPSAISLESFVVSYLEQQGPAKAIDLADAIEAAWLAASGAPLGGDLRPTLKRALDNLAARGVIVDEGIFGAWRLARPGEQTQTADTLEVATGQPFPDGNADRAELGEGDEGEASFRRPSLSALLKQTGIVTDEQIEVALAEGERTGEKLGEVIVRRGWASEEQLASLLAEQWGLATVDASALALDPFAVASLEPAKGVELGGFPVWFDTSGIVVAIAEPSEQRLSAFRGLFDNVTFVVVSRSVFQELAESRLFRGGEAAPPRPSSIERPGPDTAGTESGGVRDGDLPESAVPSTPISAAPRSLEEQLYAIGAEVRELEHALDEARRTIETRDRELAGLREENEVLLTTIHLVEEELGDRSRRLEGLREKVTDLSLALEP